MMKPKKKKRKQINIFPNELFSRFQVNLKFRTFFFFFLMYPTVFGLWANTHSLIGSFSETGSYNRYQIAG